MNKKRITKETLQDTAFLHQLITEAVEIFLDPDIRRQPELMINIWIGLRLCLITDIAKYKRKKDQITPECDTGAKLKSSICDFIFSSEVDTILAIAFRANCQAKQMTNLSYRYKCFFLNVLVLLFTKQHFVVFDEAEREKLSGLPTLLCEINELNWLNIDMGFYVDQKFTADKDLQICKCKYISDKTKPSDKEKYSLGFHLPSNQLIPGLVRFMKEHCKEPCLSKS